MGEPRRRRAAFAAMDRVLYDIGVRALYAKGILEEKTQFSKLSLFPSGTRWSAAGVGVGILRGTMMFQDLKD